MSLLAEALIGREVEAVYSDSEVTYLMLNDGTQVTMRGLVLVQPVRGRVLANVKIGPSAPAGFPGH